MTNARSCRIRPWHRALAAAAMLSLLFAPSAFAGEFAGSSSSGQPDRSREPFRGVRGRVPEALHPGPGRSLCDRGPPLQQRGDVGEQLARGMRMPTSGRPALREPGLFTNYAVGRARARANAPSSPGLT